MALVMGCGDKSPASAKEENHQGENVVVDNSPTPNQDTQNTVNSAEQPSTDKATSQEPVITEPNATESELAGDVEIAADAGSPDDVQAVPVQPQKAS